MATKSFSKSEAISFGFKKTRKNIYFLIVVLIISFVVNSLPGAISSSLNSKASLLGFLISLIGWGLQLIVGLGLVHIALNLNDGKKVSYSSLFQHSHLLIPYLFASILYGLIVVAGLILLIIPGIIWAIKYQYFTYFMVDKDLGPIEALKKSAATTNGAKWNLFLLRILLGLINILGALCLGIGLFVTIPIGMLAEAHVFRKLSGASKK